MPALPSFIINSLWDQFAALLPEHVDTHPLGCHNPRIGDRIVFDKLIQVAVLGHPPLEHQTSPPSLTYWRELVVTRNRPNRPSRPIANSHVDAILRNRCYLGVVPYEGVEYPGQHPPLVSEELFQQVQRVRATRQQSKEKPRVNSHYLKGSVFCGQCGEPLTFAKARNRQGVVYDYFVCLGRNSLQNGCKSRPIHAAALEKLIRIEDRSASVTLTPAQVGKIRGLIHEHMGVVLPSSAANRNALEGELARLDRDSQKVLDAYYADAIDVHELKDEHQARLALQRGAIEAETLVASTPCQRWTKRRTGTAHLPSATCQGASTESAQRTVVLTTYFW